MQVRCRHLWIICIAAILNACTSQPAIHSQLTMKALTIPAMGDVSEQALATFTENAPAFCHTKQTTLNVMVLSGGGADAAFGAGLISGLLARGRLNSAESPCVITGVSAGAILAPYVYLATASDHVLRQRYLPRLETLFEQIDDDTLLALNNPLRLLSDKSVYRSQNVEDALNKALDSTLLVDMATEYQQSGRKVLIGVADVYSGEFEVLDLTDQFSVAAKSPAAKQSIVSAIRASAAIPVVFAPVRMQTSQGKKLYVDGGMRYPMFLNSPLLEALRKKTAMQNSAVRVMAVVNHPGLAKPLQREKPEIDVLGWRHYMNAIGEITRNQRMLDAASRVHAEIVAHNYQGLWANGQVAYACISLKNQEKIFDQNYQHCLFEAGLELASQQQPWATKPTLPAWYLP